jgi:hypothetical protein
MSESRREIAIVVGPSSGVSRAFGRGGNSVMVERLGLVSSGGLRHAKTVCRGALGARRTAQGRVGDIDPRHVVTHPASPLLLLANLSATADAGDLFFAGGAMLWSAIGTLVGTRISLITAQPIDRSSPRVWASDTDLVPPGSGAFVVLGFGHSRGKGVLAA